MNDDKKSEFYTKILKQNDTLRFTGERLVPGNPEFVHLLQEHIIRYMFASQFTKSKTVLDAGCGTGYGSYFISESGASKVLGIDNSEEAIDYCKRIFKSRKTDFQKRDCCKSELNDSSFDVVLAFELIEHLKYYEDFLAEIKRIIKKDGIFVLSTPNIETYDVVNPFHFHEFTEQELLDLLKKYFSFVTIFYQTYPPTLSISRKNDSLSIQELSITGTNTKTEHSQYFVVVCSNKKIGHFEDKVFLFNDDTLFTKNFRILQQYVQQLREEITTKDAQLSKLDLELTTKDAQLSKLDLEITTKKLTPLQEEITTKDAQLSKLDRELTTKDAQLSKLDLELTAKDAQLSKLDLDLIMIQNSFLYKQMKKIAKIIDKIFPENSSQREIVRLAYESVRIIRVYGFSAFLKSASIKFNLKSKFSKKKISKNHHVNKSPQKKSSQHLIFETSEIIPRDIKLRKFLKLGFSDISKLDYAPFVSIIIPTYDAVDMLKSNLHSLESLTTYKNYEIIIVTNNLDINSEMRKFLASLHHSVHVFEDDFSFSKVNNFAASKAKGEYLLFLNDDSKIVSQNWIESLLKLGMQDDVGAVGAKLLLPNGKLQEAGCIIWNNGNAWNYGRNMDPNLPEYNFVREVDYCSASCLLVKTEAFRKIGGFDNNYEFAYCEDADLCLELKKHGYKVLYQPLASIIHFEGITSSKEKKVKSYQYSNRVYFFKKWKSYLQTFENDSKENSYISSNRKSGLTILYVDHYVPEVDKDAGSQNAFYTVSMLSYLGHRVIFWPENLNKIEPYTSELQQRGIEVIYGSVDLREFLKNRGKQISISILCRPHIAIYFLDKIKQYMPKCKIIYEASDIYYKAALKESEITNNKSKKRHAQKLKEIETTLIQNSDLILFRSKVDCKKVIDFDSTASSFALHIPPLYDGIVNTFDNRQNIVFVGGFRHPPNSDAVEYFLNNIFPLVVQKIPEIEFHIIGSYIPEKIKQICNENKNCVLVGYVKNISDYLNKYRVMVVPLRYGSGINGKITESMAHSLPIVTTSIGAEGLDALSDNIIQTADSPEVFAEKIIKLYQDKELWQKISINSHNYIEEQYSYEKNLDRLKIIINYLQD